MKTRIYAAPVVKGLINENIRAIYIICGHHSMPDFIITLISYRFVSRNDGKENVPVFRQIVVFFAFPEYIRIY